MNEFEIKDIDVCCGKEYDNDAVCFTVSTKTRSFDFIENVNICSDGHLLPIKEDESLIINKQLYGLLYLASSTKKEAGIEFFYDLREKLEEKLNSNGFIN